MSQPAIYVVLRDGGFLHAGHNIAGYEVDQVVALGPEVAMRYVEGLVQRPTDRNTHVANAIVDELTRAELGTDLSARLAAAGFSIDQLIALMSDESARSLQVEPDNVGFWDADCTAGALLDFDRRTLLVFTDMLDYGGRMAFLDSLTRTWPGWQVGWAYGWLTDFASYPGVLAPVAPQVLNSVEPVDALAALDERDRAVVTVRASGGEVRTYEMNVWAGPEPWWIGTRLLELLREDQRCIRPTRMPAMGMHVDVDDAAAGVWTTRWWPGLKDSWSQLWPGWSLEFWDRSEEHVARTGGALELPSIDPDAELDRYARRLDGLWLPILRERRKSPVDPTYPADFVDLSEHDYQRQRRVATDRPR